MHFFVQPRKPTARERGRGRGVINSSIPLHCHLHLSLCYLEVTRNVEDFCALSCLFTPCATRDALLLQLRIERHNFVTNVVMTSWLIVNFSNLKNVLWEKREVMMQLCSSGSSRSVYGESLIYAATVYPRIWSTAVSIGENSSAYDVFQWLSATSDVKVARKLLR